MFFEHAKFYKFVDIETTEIMYARFSFRMFGNSITVT
jgi:hypothetical protein